LIVAMVVSGAAGNWIGEEALNRISERNFRLLLQIILSALALQLIWHAVR